MLACSLSSADCAAECFTKAIPSVAKAGSALVHRWEALVYAGSTAHGEPDQTSIEMHEAKQIVEAALRPYVQVPTFRQFLSVDRFWSAVRRSLTTHWSRPGYGKIAVYAAVPVTGRTAESS